MDAPENASLAGLRARWAETAAAVEVELEAYAVRHPVPEGDSLPFPTGEDAERQWRLVDEAQAAKEAYYLAARVGTENEGMPPLPTGSGETSRPTPSSAPERNPHVLPGA